MSDDYLWDGSGEPDADFEELETALAELRHDGVPPALPDAPHHRGGSGWLGIAAAAAVVIAALAVVTLIDRGRPAWDVARLAGSPRVGGAALEGEGRLAMGESLETDASSRAKIRVGEIGEVVVDPDTRIVLAAAEAGHHRLALQQGTIHAFIVAPPGEFLVETPSALAVDLGCAYTLQVDEEGAGQLEVTMGWVAFEHAGRESFVPAGARCLMRPEHGPGTPWLEDASEALREALVVVDFGGGDVGSALDTVLTEARPEDALTVWHLLSRVEGDARERAHDRMAELVERPDGVTREGILRGDQAMLDAWWNALDLEDVTWWRQWKGPVPGELR